MTYRKVLLTGVAYLALGMGAALAANVSTVTQSGSGNTANVDQSLGTNGDSTVTQEGPTGTRLSSRQEQPPRISRRSIN